MDSRSKFIITTTSLVAVIIGITIYLNSPETKKSLLPADSTSQTSTEGQETPPTYHIDNVPYYSELTGNIEGFCYGYSSMMLLEHYGFTKDEVKSFRDFIQEQGRGGPPDAFMGFEKLGLRDKVHIGYSSDYSADFAQVYKTFVNNKNNQIHIFDSQETASQKLKELISSDIPTIVLINNGTDYDVAIGYDNDYVYLNDPHDKGGAYVKISWDKFLVEWNSEEAGAPGEIAFPGNWGMIWLEK